MHHLPGKTVERKEAVDEHGQQRAHVYHKEPNQWR
jgi:hypothetical protein